MSGRKGPVKPVFINDVELDSFYITEGMIELLKFFLAQLLSLTWIYETYITTKLIITFRV